MKRPRPKPVTSPLLPRGVEIIVPPPPFEACTLVDRLLVYASSLVVVGSPIWFYGGLIFLYRRWRRYRDLARGGADGGGGDSHERSPDDDGDDDDGSSRRRSICEKLASRYGAALAILVLASMWGPHRNRRVGEMLDVRRWRLWDAWLSYVGLTVLRDAGGVATSASDAVVDDPRTSSFDPLTSPAMYAFVPHGIFPFGLALAALPERGYGTTWGRFRPVVATATRLFPLVRTFIDWMGGVDASRTAVSRALSPRSPGGGTTRRRSGSGGDDGNRRLGISPGGIAEMFESYPKPGYHRNDEAALLRHRDGLFRLALRHRIPIVPVYCFGATKMFRRVQLPQFVETLSRALRISLCLLYGRWGLPIPFRQRLTYVVGNAIWPPGGATTAGDGATAATIDERLVREMHDAFCDEIGRIFDRNKGHYGWEDKTLRLV